MSIFLPGAPTLRRTRSSQLVHGWQSRRRKLDAYTGQVGRFYIVTPGAAGTITGRNGVAVPAGHGQPRWEQVPTQGTKTRLTLVGDVGGQDVERLEHDYLNRVFALSLYVKAWPLYTPGQNLGSPRPLISLGNATTGGGSLTIDRNGTAWRAVRARGAGSAAPQVTEPGTAVFPIEIMATMSRDPATDDATVALLYRDGAGALLSAVGIVLVDGALLTEYWAGNILFSTGGAYRLETVKIARGVQTFASMDLLN